MGVHDSGYKHLFSFPTMVEDLLRGFVREQWVDELDFGTLERKNGSYISDDLKEREDDIIWRAKWKNADHWMYVYFLIEFQTEHDKFMSVRVLNYLSLLYQDLIKTGEVRGRFLPPVLPMVVYRGEQKWTSPVDVRDVIQRPPPGLSRYLPSLKYLLLEEVRMNEAELESMCSLTAEIFRIEKSKTLRAAIPPFLSFLKWTTKAGAQQDSLKRAMKVWFIQAQKPAKIIDTNDSINEMELEEIEPMLSERIEKWSKELVDKGRVEGEAKGKAEGKAEGIQKVAKNLLQKGMPADQVAEVTGLSEEEINALSDSLAH
jgi:predicted transposase/invertase (TIGR01784 family)